MNNSFKNEYFSIDGWMKQTFMNYKDRLEEVRVEDGETTREQKIENSILIFKVRRDELYKANELAEKMNEVLNNKRVAENRKTLQNYKDVSNMLDSKREERKTEERKTEEAFNDVSKIVNAEEKKEVKGAPKKQKPKKFRLLAVIIAGGTLVAGTAKGINEINDYKEEVAERSVKVLKDAIGAEKIMDYSTILGSDKALVHYEVTTPEGVYEYKEQITSDGNLIRENDFDDVTLEALDTVFNAQDGNLFNAIKADKLIESIKNGEIELNNLDNIKNIELDDGR